MPTFIDESGDTGSASGGGKPYFRLAAVWMPTLDEAEKFRAAVRKLRRDLHLRTNYEFKFAATWNSDERRFAFFKTALNHEFKFAACSIDKTSNCWKNASGRELHWACATSLAVILRPRYHEVEARVGAPLREPVIVDNNSEGNYLDTVKKAFRGLESKSKPGSSLIGIVKFRKSAPDEMIQLADMVCGAVGAHLDEKDHDWFALIRGREIETFCLP